MARVVKCGLIQATHACSTDEPLEKIREANVEKHLKFLDQAGKEGVQIICMQEIFTGPYFCAEQNTKWYDATEKIPDGPTTRLMQEVAKRLIADVCFWLRRVPGRVTREEAHRSGGWGGRGGTGVDRSGRNQPGRLES